MRLAVCKDHLELAIDIFVDETGDPPDLLTLPEAHEQFPGWVIPVQCERCAQQPVAIVSPCGG